MMTYVHGLVEFSSVDDLPGDINLVVVKVGLDLVLVDRVNDWSSVNGIKTEARLTGIDDDQDPLPPLVDLRELAMLDIEYRSIEVEVVLQSFVSLDLDGSLGVLGDFGGKV
jgi:hypothetical protein